MSLELACSTRPSSHEKRALEHSNDPMCEKEAWKSNQPWTACTHAAACLPVHRWHFLRTCGSAIPGFRITCDSQLQRSPQRSLATASRLSSVAEIELWQEQLPFRNRVKVRRYTGSQPRPFRPSARSSVSESVHFSTFTAHLTSYHQRAITAEDQLPNHIQNQNQNHEAPFPPHARALRLQGHGLLEEVQALGHRLRCARQPGLPMQHRRSGAFKSASPPVFMAHAAADSLSSL